MNLERYSDAVSAFTAAIRLDPENHELWFQKGTGLSSLGQPQPAASAFEKAIAIRPDDVRSHLGLARAFVALEKDEDAVQSFDAILERSSEDITAWYEKGLALYRLEKFGNP